jgi:LysR family carnitine catabolism transcriptional activator
MNLNPRPTLRQLRAAVTLAETGQFTQAAERLGVSQSSLSASIGELERALAVRLFDRHTRMLRPTQAGAEIIPQMRRVLADLDRLIGSSRQVASLQRGHLSVAAPTIQSAIWLPRHLKAFKRDYPEVRVTLHDAPEQEIRQLVRSGVADIGICTVADFSGDLKTRPFYRDSYVLALHPRHPLAAKSEITWRELRKVPVIAPRADNPVRMALDRALMREGLALTYAHEVSLPWTMAGLARSRLGVAVLTDAVRDVAQWMGLVVRPIHRPSIRREVVLITLKDRSLSPSAQRFFDLLLQHRNFRISDPES